MSAITARLIKHGRDAIAKYKDSLSKDPEQTTPTFFAKMLQSKDLSDVVIEIEAANITVAGSDTTANTLTYLIWIILKHPEVHTRVMQEVSGLVEPFTDDHIATKLPYVGWVIEETLRLYGAVPNSLPREVPPGGREMLGYFVPGGTTVSAQSYTLHRDGEIYKDPLRQVFENLLCFRKNLRFTAIDD